jgi:hypothetical protein
MEKKRPADEEIGDEKPGEEPGKVWPREADTITFKRITELPRH